MADAQQRKTPARRSGARQTSKQTRKATSGRRSAGASPARSRTAPARRKRRRSGEAAVRCVDAVKVYGTGDAAVRALDGVTLDIPAGRFTAIMGPSGSGKSTLMHGLAGLDPFTSGEAYVGDVRIDALSDADLTRFRRESIGFVFQTFNLVPTLSARENVTLPLRLGGRDTEDGWIDDVIEQLNIGHRLRNRPAELSGGERQRVAIARALVTKPKVVFADEPTGNLDSVASQQLLEFLSAAVVDFGQTIVMVTHEPIAATYADSVLFLSDGRIVHEMDQPSVRKILNVMEKLGERSS